MYLDKIYKVLDTELDNAISNCCNNKELLYELELIKEESAKTYSALIQKNYNVILNKKYKEVYEKTINAIEYIKSKNDNSIMIDYLSEAYTNILDYSEVIMTYKEIKGDI